MSEFSRSRNLAAALTLGLGLAACGPSEQAPAPTNVPMPPVETTAPGPGYTRDLRPPIVCAVEKPNEWIMARNIDIEQRPSIITGVDIILGVSKQQVLHGEVGEAKCSQNLTSEDMERPASVSGKGDLCMVASVAAKRHSDGSVQEVPSEDILAICPTATQPTETPFPRSELSKIDCSVIKIDSWRDAPPKHIEEFSERLGVSEERVRNGRLGNVICLEQLDPVADLWRPINTEGYGEDCMAAIIRREPNSTPGYFTQAVYVACAEPLK